jgi:hypothetical protein
VEIDVDVSGIESTVAHIERTAEGIEHVEYIVGAEARYSVYVEYGTRHMPPYPYMRPAVQVVMEGGQADAIAAAATSTEQLIRGIAFAIEREAKHFASTGVAPGPDVRSGNLRRSISARRVA